MYLGSRERNVGVSMVDDLSPDFPQTFPIQMEFERISLYFNGLRADGKGSYAIVIA